jgi:hypothetical protein
MNHGTDDIGTTASSPEDAAVMPPAFVDEPGQVEFEFVDWITSHLGISTVNFNKILGSLLVIVLLFLVRMLVMRVIYRKHDDIRIPATAGERPPRILQSCWDSCSSGGSGLRYFVPSRPFQAWCRQAWP